MARKRQARCANVKQLIFLAALSLLSLAAVALSLAPTIRPFFDALPLGVCGEAPNVTYSATGESLEAHRVPAWFQDAKFGIFIHWGLYSVPAFASRKYMYGQPKKNKTDFDLHNPYAEWYLHSSMIKGSSTEQVHFERYGEQPSEESYLRLFVPRFNQEVASWRPTEWAQLFRDAGARYVVLTTKHHDSFCLWPTATKNPQRKDEYQHATRDIVGDLTRAVRNLGMEMGLYYSGGHDWSFSLSKQIVQTPAYEDLAYGHLEELIAKYRPAVLWDDISWPGSGYRQKKRIYKIFADYFSKDCPQGTINDRWMIEKKGFAHAYSGDFETPEYKTIGRVEAKPFEMNRGIGRSFGYNAEEGPEDYMTAAEAAWLLADVTAKNGNLLLDVGPAANGSIPEGQMKVLLGLARWMRVAAEAIHGTRPYLAPGGGLRPYTRYTRKGRKAYAMVKADSGSRSMQPCKLKVQVLCTISSGEMVVRFDREEFMRREAHAELLLPGGALRMDLHTKGWILPASYTDFEMPVVVRLDAPTTQ